MDRMISTSTIDTGHTELQTTLYDLMQAMQDEAGPDAEHLVVATVVRLLRSGRIRFLGQPAHPASMGGHEVLPVSA